MLAVDPSLVKLELYVSNAIHFAIPDLHRGVRRIAVTCVSIFSAVSSLFYSYFLTFIVMKKSTNEETLEEIWRVSDVEESASSSEPNYDSEQEEYISI